MKTTNLIPFLALLTLLVSCHKDHTPSGPIAPVLETIPPTGIANSSASTGGTFTTTGTFAIADKGIQWDTTSQFSSYRQVSAGTGAANFSTNLTGLFPNTTYYARAYATMDSTHAWFGNTVQFTTTYTPGKYQVTTLAGTGARGSADGSAATATFYAPAGVAVDQQGNIFVADEFNKAIRKITPAGDISTLARMDGYPTDVITDTAGNVYVSETSFRILKITSGGQVSTVAGLGIQGHTDGPGSSATFTAPTTLAIDPAGNLYVGDEYAFRKITAAGAVSTLTNYFPGANSSWVIAVDNQFNVYESDGHTAIKVDTSGTETFLAGTGQDGDADGTGAAAAFGNLQELRLDPAGNIYITDAKYNKIKLITQGGVVSTIAGTGAEGFLDGNSAIATFNRPSGLAIDNSGNIIVADLQNNKIRKVTLH